MKPIVAQVVSDSAGNRAGLLAGDEILAVNGKKITLWEELVQQIQSAQEFRSRWKYGVERPHRHRGYSRCPH